ncbi:MAG: hypothetical protein AM1032_000043 [Mycoplasmataceae bacterium]|nr:MAG: hypothetical protein AM1032_000043 [Mycoplasmataceae bacterium]
MKNKEIEKIFTCDGCKVIFNEELFNIMRTNNNEIKIYCNKCLENELNNQ